MLFHIIYKYECICNTFSIDILLIICIKEIQDLLYFGLH